MGTGKHLRLDFLQRSQALVVVIRTDIENGLTGLLWSVGKATQRIKPVLL
jgi:hypothetical protein